LVKAGALVAMPADPGHLLALVASAVSGFAAIGLLLRYVRAASYTPFVVYRLLLAAVIVGVAL
jgi:undecaprenyl pyrophosphate phosphatase UppP